MSNSLASRKRYFNPHGLPDFTLPVSIIAQVIESLKVDIVAQSLASLKIDIASQSLSSVNVAIQSSAVTLNVNIASSSVTLPISIQSQAVTLNVAIQSSSVTLNVNIASITSGVVFNVAQSGSWTINAVQSGSWTINIGAPLDASGYLETSIMASVTLDVNIASQSVTLNVAIQSSAVTLNVAIQSSAVTLPISIQSQAVTLNVAIQGTANVNIADAIVSISTIKLIDTGTIVRVSGSGINTELVLYTVPTGKRFYPLSVFLNIESVGGGYRWGRLYFYDGTTAYEIIRLTGPDSVRQANQGLAFNLVSIPAGWSIRCGSNSYTRAYAAVLGVEISA
jgi:hypothetical protein